MDVNELREEAVEEARDIAEDAEGRLRGEGFDVQVAAPVGQPGPTICEWAKEEDVDCIVMGRRGRGLVGEVLLGSVSHYVVHHAPCPVTVVSAGEPAG